MGKRGFAEAMVASTGYQNYKDRFGTRQRGNDCLESPPTAHWRCNLVCATAECQCAIATPRIVIHC